MLVLRGSLDRESLRLGVVRLKTAEQRLAWLADHLAEQPGLGHRLLPHRRGHPGDRRLPAQPRATRSRPTPARPTPPSGSRSRRTCWPAGSRRWSPRAPSGWASTPPRLRRQHGRARRRRSPTTSRSAAPVAAPTRPAWCCSPRSRTATSGPTSPRWPSRARSWSARPSRCSPAPSRPMSTAALETYVDLSRTRLETMLKVLDVDGAVRRVRGGWEATGAALGLRRGALPPGGRGPRARAAGDARLPRHRPSAGCAFLREQLDDPEAEPTAAAATTAAGSTLSATVSADAVAEADGAAGPARRGRSSRARCGRPRWPTSASTSRARSPRAPRRAGRSPGSPTSATGRRCGRCSGRRPRTARCRRRW